MFTMDLFGAIHIPSRQLGTIDETVCEAVSPDGREGPGYDVRLQAATHRWILTAQARAAAAGHLDAVADAADGLQTTRYRGTTSAFDICGRCLCGRCS
jgi:hypothetical protein